MSELSFADIRIGPVKSRAITVGVQEMNHSRHHSGFPGQPARITGDGNGPIRGAVIRTVTREDLVFASVSPGKLDGILVGVCTTQGVEELGQTIRDNLRQQLAQHGTGFGGHTRPRKWELPCLVYHGFDYSFIAMSNVDAHHHRVQVQVTLVIDVPKIDPLGLLDGNRRYMRLRRPGPKIMF
ncbi:hypothetical protein SDC9_96565 [bioreactor metagenome]|uniref:Uncharacterized protein n=1 Tax=bioreactor metagenome TaxID=1076179 RepID=A0A645AG82_9ZZZZ